MKDMKSNLDVVVSIDPDDYTASANGASADLRGYDGAMIVLAVGTITDGTHTPKVQESDDDSTWNDVAAADLSGALAALVSDTPQRVDYVGVKRYIRAVLTVAGATTGAQVASIIVRGCPHQAPLS